MVMIEQTAGNGLPKVRQYARKPAAIQAECVAPCKSPYPFYRFSAMLVGNRLRVEDLPPLWARDLPIVLQTFPSPPTVDEIVEHIEIVGQSEPAGSVINEDQPWLVAADIVPIFVQHPPLFGRGLAVAVVGGRACRRLHAGVNQSDDAGGGVATARSAAKLQQHGVGWPHRGRHHQDAVAGASPLGDDSP